MPEWTKSRTGSLSGRPRSSPSRSRTTPTRPSSPSSEEPEPEDARADYLVNTVGYLVRRSPRFVSVAQEILPDGDGFRAVTHIPVAVVQTIAPLRDSDGAGMDDVLAL